MKQSRITWKPDSPRFIAESGNCFARVIGSRTGWSWGVVTSSQHKRPATWDGRSLPTRAAAQKAATLALLACARQR